MILLDTSIWIALLDQDDPWREKAKNIVKNMYYEDLEIYDYIYTEILTVLRNKTTDDKCYEFIQFLKNSEIKTILSDEHIFFLATAFFFQYNKLSFTDCLLMASAKLNNSKLMSFDKELEKAWKKVVK